MAVGEFKQHHGHEPNGAWWGCSACNPVDNGYSIKGLRKLVHLPSEEELTAIIYQCRWVDGIKKDGALASDQAIATAIIEFLKA
jgi:hypothetical protein